MSPMVRSALTHVGTAAGTGVAVVMYLASDPTNIMAAYDQLNTVVADVTKLLATLTPLATGAYAVYRSTTKNKLADIEQDPRVKGIVAAPELAADLGPKVQPTVSALPVAAKVATDAA